jgi:hypothetical protein
MFSKFYPIGIAFAIFVGILNGSAFSDNCGGYPLSPGFSCCNGVHYLSQFGVCCEGKVVDFDQCCNGKICCKPQENGGGCCNGQIMSANEECCEGQIISYPECCHCPEYGSCLIGPCSGMQTPYEPSKPQPSLPGELPRKTVQSEIPSKKTTRG